MFGMKNAEIGIAMMQAHDIAAELGHPEVGPDHILLGLTTNLRGTAQQLLANHGLTYSAARVIVAAQRDASNLDDSGGDHPDDVSLDDDRDALASLGIDLDKVTAAVGSAFGEDITRAWGRRRERDPRSADAADNDSTGKGAGSDQAHHVRGRRGPRHNGPGFAGPDLPQPPLPPEFPDFPTSEWFPLFGGPRGRGRRGPQSQRFGGGPRWSEATTAMFHELRNEIRDAVRGMEDRRGAWPQVRAVFQPERLLLAILDSPDPATQALVSSATDVPGLRATLCERLEAGTAA